MPSKYHVTDCRCAQKSRSHWAPPCLIGPERAFIDSAWELCSAARALALRFLSKTALSSHDMTQKMSDLPPDRITPGTAPFAVTGVDLFGLFCQKRPSYSKKIWGNIRMPEDPSCAFRNRAFPDDAFIH